MTRRELIWAAGAGVAAGARAQGLALTARQVIERIQANVGVPWRTPTVDTFKAGNPDTPVKAIATTVMATLAVLEKAAAAGRNLVITHEPTFWSHLDTTAGLKSDPVFQDKLKFIESNGMVVWRFHDHWHARKPDAMLTGLAETLGWTQYRTGEDGRRYKLPETTLEAMAESIQEHLGAQGLRVIGDRGARVSTVAMSPGAGEADEAERALLAADVLVVGEQREWETVEYAQDAIATGRRKGMVILGHAISEDPGMRVCAEWLKGVVKEVDVAWIPAGEPFWRPGRCA